MSEGHSPGRVLRTGRTLARLALVWALLLGVLAALGWPLVMRIALPVAVFTLGFGSFLIMGAAVLAVFNAIPGVTVSSIRTGVVVAAVDVYRELVAAGRQRRADVRPRVQRGGFYPIARVGSTVIVRDVVVNAVLEDMLAGRSWRRAATTWPTSPTTGRPRGRRSPTGSARPSSSWWAGSAVGRRSRRRPAGCSGCSPQAGRRPGRRRPAAGRRRPGR